MVYVLANTYVVMDPIITVVGVFCLQVRREVVLATLSEEHTLDLMGAPIVVKSPYS